MGSVVNLADFCGVLVVDKWLGNTDYRQSVFTSVRNIDRTLSFEAQMIDNGQMFDGGNWRFEDSHLRGPCTDDNASLVKFAHFFYDACPFANALS